jgi:dCTP deaminase
MAILARDEILRRIELGEIRIDPFSEDQVGPASVDLHIDRVFRIFRPQEQLHHVLEDAEFEQITELIEVDDYLVLQPGGAALGITQERITLPDDICGWLQGRSRFARLGLMVHITASFMQPGIANRQVLELINQSPVSLAIHPGVAVCQFVFEECRGSGHYTGRFRDQMVP